jgi:MFS transporter, BCD family, chlorophyll transporter
MSTPDFESASLRWTAIIRLGLVQMALGSMTVIAISTLNRIMVIEYRLPALVPGALVALHYLVQMMRPRLGHGSDQSGRRVPWIAGGLVLLAAGTIAAAAATASLGTSRGMGLAAAMVAYVAIGLGVGAAGTSLLALLGQTVAAHRRAAAATVLWIMMIAGFALTAGLIGRFLDPYSPARLVTVTACAVLLALAIALAALAGLEGRVRVRPAPTAGHPGHGADFGGALRSVWADGRTRRFTGFIFVSMLAYSALELLLEPFAGHVFGLTPGASSRLVGSLHSGAVLGMVAVAVLTARFQMGSPAAWVRAGCAASAVLLAVLALSSANLVALPLKVIVSGLGFATGAFTVSAIGVMMELAGERDDGRAGMRMGLWGAAQAVAFAAGGVASTVAIDLARRSLGTSTLAYAVVFSAEALLFLAAALMMVEAGKTRRARAGGTGLTASLGRTAA